MNKEYLLEYPPSYTYSEIIDKIDNKIGTIAYCYVGEKEGNILLVDEMGSIKSIPYSMRYNNVDLFNILKED